MPHKTNGMLTKCAESMSISPASARAVAYVRVSRGEQVLGQAAQQDDLVRWCAQNNVTLVATHTDIGISGDAAIQDRPGLLSALHALRSEAAGMLLVTKRDRLARSTAVAAMAEHLVASSGARIISIADQGTNSDDPSSQLMRYIIDQFAAYELHLIRARTQTAMDFKRARGECLGQVPFGYRLAADGINLELEPSEAAIINRVRELRSRGLSIRSIARRLNDDCAPARGKQWHATTIARLLRKVH